MQDPGYGAAVAAASVSDALNLLNAKLTQAVIDGEVECLPSLYAHRAIWYLKLQMVRKAVKDLESAVKMDPSSIDACVLLVKCYRELKRPDDAYNQVQKLRGMSGQFSTLSALGLAEVLELLDGHDMTSPPKIDKPPATNGLSSALAPPPPTPALPPAEPPATAPSKMQQENRPSKANGKMFSGMFGAAPKTTARTEAAPEQQTNGSLKPEPQPAELQRAPSPSRPPARRPASDESHARPATLKSTVIIEEEPSTSEPSTSTSAPSPTRKAKAVKPAVPSSKQLDKNVSISGHEYLQLIESHNVIAQCIEQINAGNLNVAEGALNDILKSQPQNFDALVARGTCRALNGELATAESDFTKAIDIRPEHADVWKRRAQARGARGNYAGAASDLQEALKRLDPNDDDGRIEALFESAMLQHKLRNFRRAHGELLQLVKIRKDHKQALSMLGLTATAMGNIQDGIGFYKRALALDENFKDGWVNIFQSYKESGQTRNAEEAFLKIIALDTPQTRSLHSYRMMGHMRQCMGQHYKAVEILTKALTGTTVTFQKLEITFLRGACYHAMGRLKEAHADYERCLTEELNQATAATETKQFQALAYYQRELTIYVHRVQDRPVTAFCIDKDLDAMFKEHWSKQVMPTKMLLERCRPLLPANAAFPSEPRPLPTPPPAPQLTALLDVADNIGTLLQYSHQGFLNNGRQQRAAGLAAIELAQKVLEDVRERRRGSNAWVDSAGASGGAGGSGRHAFEWRDGMDILVRWRQQSEPNDQVLWVDLLTPEEFNKGFGSHTPMYSGQTKCVRYYMNFERAFKLFKDIIVRQGFAMDGNNQTVPITGKKVDRLLAAKTCEDAWDIIGTDSWVVVPIQSKYRPGNVMDGTRLTLTKFPPSHQPEAHEFSIRTPVTPARWKDFDIELGLCWNAIMEAAISGDARKTAECILHFVYFWYNFMPLARGSAAVGYTTILALFWTFDMPISVNIPADYQTDWEAMLTQEADGFVAELSRWMFPPKVAGEGQSGNANEEKLAKYGEGPLSLPSVLEVVGTIRKRFYALNYNTPAQKKK